MAAMDAAMPAGMPALSVRRLALVAAVAGLAAGMAFTVLQQVFLVPAILRAEVLEAGGRYLQQAGLSRLVLTFVFNCLAGFGYALLLLAGMALRGHSGWLHGLLWGASGWLCFAFAPAIGSPPELPGAVETALAGRQLWWVAAAAGAAVGLTLVAFGRNWRWRLVGVLLAALPHLADAPGPSWQGLPSAGLRFAVGALAAGGLFWLTLGAAAGIGLARSWGR
jgi:cobalt transporter subunit CbtA